MRARALLAVTVLALALRLWALDSVPPGVDTDEASIGYIVFAIARTGRDEHGAFLPLSFEAFGEFKRPAYIYAAVPFVAVIARAYWPGVRAFSRASVPDGPARPPAGTETVHLERGRDGTPILQLVRFSSGR